jgi:hypothetical protein
MPRDEFEARINQEGISKADFLEVELEFLAPVSLEDPVDPQVATALRLMVDSLHAALWSCKPLDLLYCRSVVRRIAQSYSWSRVIS